MNTQNNPDPLTLQLALSQIQEYYLEIKSMVQNLESKLRGDIIEQGGIKTINNYYYPPQEDHKPVTVPASQRLQSDQALHLMQSLADAGLLDDDWQPLNLSGSERALLAKAVSDRLQINDCWQVFGGLWNSNPSTLRSSYNKAMEQKKTYHFLEKLQKILDWLIATYAKPYQVRVPGTYQVNQNAFGDLCSSQPTTKGVDRKQ